MKGNFPDGPACIVQKDFDKQRQGRCERMLGLPMVFSQMKSAEATHKKGAPLEIVQVCICRHKREKGESHPTYQCTKAAKGDAWRSRGELQKHGALELYCVA